MYDDGTRPEHFLRAYAREFGSVEVDATFYGTPPPERVRGWCAAVPRDFTFALKLPRELSHDRRLVGGERELETFVERAREFGAQLEGVLVQLPPDFTPHESGTLFAFVQRLPTGIRWSVEFRNPGWYERETLAQVRCAFSARGVAIAASDGTFVDLDTTLAAFAEPTAAHAYIRWLGVWNAVEHFNNVVFDRTAELARWAGAVRATPCERVCGYANNFYMGHSPATVRAFYAALGVLHERPPHIEQTSLF
jgi:uncharacterized protein YecE (DUF72 family)